MALREQVAPETATSGGARPALLSIIVPTFNESANVPRLVAAVEQALAGVAWEIIFVDDDSPDGTAEAARKIAQSDVRVRCIQRIGRRGLSSACVEGAMSSSAPYIAVMDGDLQHDEKILPQMLAAVRDDGRDIAVGSRYVSEGGVGDWSEDRQRASRLATRLAQGVIRTPLQDPMSGFFLIRRDVFLAAAPRLSTIGFKLLLDLFASAGRPLNFVEVPYEFRSRTEGESKLDIRVLWEFGMMLVDKSIGAVIPARLVSFAAVGGMGVAVHMLVLFMLQQAGLAFMTGHIIATFVAMTFNFWLNNLLTYSDQRLKGWGLVTGWASFVLACSFGAAANVGVAGVLVTQNNPWALSALAGIAVGTIWNFAVTSTLTWKAK